MIIRKKGFTLIELMIGLILITLIITALWDVYSSSRRNANEIIANHTLNSEIEMILMRIADDLRESNAINASYPTILLPTEVEELNNDEAGSKAESLMAKDTNKLVFTKINYDFEKDPSTLGAGEKNYTKEIATYTIEKMDDAYCLIRESDVFDEKDTKIEDGTTIRTFLRSLKSCVFYQIKDENSSRTGNVYIRIEFIRKDSAFKSNYSNTITITVKERASCPE